LTKITYDVKTLVLKKNLEENDAMYMVDQKKTKPFKSLLSRAKKEDVQVQSLKLNYECILMISGKYIADYFKKATHSISVNSNIREIILGGRVFPIRSKSKLQKAFVGKRGKNKIDLKLEEHIFVEEEDELAFDQNGRDLKFPFKINSKTTEHYPKRILEKNNANIKKSQISYYDAIKKLESQLKQPLEENTRDLTEEFVLREITEIYVPIFEARLVGPKGKAGIIRIDAVRKKIL